MVYKHQWRPGSRLTGDPDKVAKHLESIANKHGGDIQPPQVVSDARHKRSPLHRYFEWDDGAAAEQFRLAQARHLINSIQVLVVDDGEPIRAFHNVNLSTVDTEDELARGYVTLDRAANEELLRLQIVRRLYSQAKSFAREARAFEEFAGVVRALEELPPLVELERRAAAA
jgi:hypothetical protein